MPIRLFEIGSSAGLNLRGDHYRYGFAGGQWGPADSPVTIDDAWRGALPPRRETRIVARHGYDIAPIDVGDADGEMTVLSYVWPDQGARLVRLRGAIEVARRVPAVLERRTAADAVAGLTLAEGALTVLWHSITWQYLSADERAAVRVTWTRWPAGPMRARRSPTSRWSQRATGRVHRSSSWCGPASGRRAIRRCWVNVTHTARR